MSSQSFNHKITNNNKNEEVYKCDGWVHLVAMLESSADGANYIKLSGEYAKVEPGRTLSIILAPGTIVRIKTTCRCVRNSSCTCDVDITRSA